MSREIKQKADDLVCKFIQTLKEGYEDWGTFDGIVEEDAIKCAILHQERLIEGCIQHFHPITPYLVEQKEILTELKSRL